VPQPKPVKNRSKTAVSPTLRYEEAIILGVGLLLALWLRFMLWPYETADYLDYFGPWYDYIQSNGGFWALADIDANYTPPYLYALTIVATLLSGLPKLLAIKLIGISFDFVAALLVYKIVRLRHPQSIAPLLATLLFLFAPTVLLNSALWGQADIIYTTGLLACLYLLLRQKPAWAFVAFGLALAVKLQAIFLLPLLLILLWRRQLVRWFHFLILPLVYLLTIIPAWVAGRPFTTLITIYLQQANTYRSLARNVPNLYQWLPNSLYDLIYPAGMIFALAGMGLFVLVVHKSGIVLTNGRLLQIGLLSTLLMPYLLPKMHERYFFTADILSLILIFYYPRLLAVPLFVIAASFFSYLPYLFKLTIIPFPLLAFLPLAAIFILLWHLLAEPIAAHFGQNH
jgi:Gpi18-like mannosyltransferase